MFDFKRNHLLIFLLLPFCVWGQLDEEMDSSGFVLKMNNTINLRFDLDNDLRTFEVDAQDQEYSVQPNTDLRTSIAYNYRSLSFRIGFSPKFLSGDDVENKGKTKVFKFSLDIFMNDFLQNFEYNRVKGYYVKGFDLSLTDLPFNENNYIKLPDLSSVSFTGTTYYRFNSNYSFKAVVNQTEIQTKSVGSFIPSLQYGYFKIAQPSGPEDVESYFFLLNAGYYHTFVLHENWYANLGLSAGAGIEFNRLTIRTETDTFNSRNNSMAFDLNTQLGLGYNSRRFYAGTSLVGNAISRDDRSALNFTNVRSYFKIYVGYRFDPPDSFIKAMDWIDSKNPFLKKNKP